MLPAVRLRWGRPLWRAGGTRGSRRARVPVPGSHSPAWAGQGRAAAAASPRGTQGRERPLPAGAPQPLEAGARFWARTPAQARPGPALPALQRHRSAELRAAPRPASPGPFTRPRAQEQGRPRGAEPWPQWAVFFGFSLMLFANACVGHSPSPQLPAQTPLTAPPEPHPQRHSGSSQGPALPGLPHCRNVPLSRPFQSCLVLGVPKAFCEGGAPQSGWGHGAAVPGGVCSTWRANVSNPFYNGLRWCVVV